MFIAGVGTGHCLTNSNEINRELLDASFRGNELMVQIMLERGASVDARSGRGSTALILAASQGHMSVVQILLENGADIDDSTPFTLFHLAGQLPHQDHRSRQVEFK